MMIVMRGRVGYPGGPPVVELDVEIGAGARVALVGGNGAGKTTILRALCGLAVGAEVRIDGRPVTRPEHAVAAGAALVFQNPDDQLFAQTVREDVEYGPRNLGLAEPEIERRTRDALEATGIAALAERPIETLSFGEKKRASLAGALAMQPRVLLLDEPTAGLDPAFERVFVGHLDRLAGERALTLVMATHAIDLVPYLARRVLLIGDGRVLKDGPPGSVLLDAEPLERARVRRPIASELGAALGLDPLPLTVEDARRSA
jgi:cobalt/nickel transport system ATP-binding protein